MEINWKKNAVLFLSGQSISIFGSMLVQYAIMWYITLRTQSGSMMTIFIIAGILPTFFISPLGGVWADRFNRKYLINIADSVIALATLIVAILFLLGFEHIGLLLFCAAIRGLGQGVQTPAVNSFIPQIIPKEHLTRINAINSSIQSFTMLIAPMASGALLVFASIKIIFFLDVITALIGIGILFLFVKVPSVKNANEEQNTELSKGMQYFYELKDGIQYIKNHGYILRLICISSIFFVAAAPLAFLTPLQVARNFGAEVWRLTVIEAVFSGGMILGGLIIGIWGGFKNRIYSMAIACALFGVESIALGLLHNFLFYVIIMMVSGMTMPFYNTPSMVVLQSKVSSEYQGRVFGVFGMVSSLMMPVGMLVFGPLGDIVGIDLLLVGTGVILMLLSIPFVLSKVMREAGKIAS